MAMARQSSSRSPAYREDSAVGWDQPEGSAHWHQGGCQQFKEVMASFQREDFWSNVLSTGQGYLLPLTFKLSTCAIVF